MLIWAAAGVAAAGAVYYLFSQKAGGIQNAIQDKANEGLTPAPAAEEKPCGCGMEKSNHSFS